MSALWHVGFDLAEMACVRADSAERAAVEFVRTHDRENDFNVAGGELASVYVSDGCTPPQQIVIHGEWTPMYAVYRGVSRGGVMK